MSNLNVNNIDVQRIINVLTELLNKIELCSFLTFKSMNNIETSKDQIRQIIHKKEFLEDLERHFEYMNSFRMKHIEIEEEEKEGEKNSELGGEENFDELEEGQNHSKEKEKKEIKDLLGINENTSKVTEELAKSTRKLCRKYHKEFEILKILKEYRADSEIKKFCDNFSFILAHFTKKSKMTLEEEHSDKTLNASLTSKIIDLEYQIKVKTEKYENLKRERQNFKTNCNNQLNDIENEIKNLRDTTKMELTQLEDEINRELNRDYDKNQQKLLELKEKLNLAVQEYEEKKKKDEDEEKKAVEQYNTQEGNLRNNIGEYDAFMTGHKDKMEENRKIMKVITEEVITQKNRRDRAKESYENYNEEFKKYEEKLKILKYENDMKIRASEWIQGQFKGFIYRKANKKKFAKILAPLKKVPLENPDPKNKNKNKRK